MKRGGFSLAEVVLSLAFLALILVMAVAILHFSLQSDRHSEHVLRALSLAQQKLAEGDSQGQGAFAAPWQDYHYQLTRNELGQGLIRVEARVDGPARSSAQLTAVRRQRRREIVLSERINGSWRLARVCEEGGPRRLLPSTGASDTQPAVSRDGQTLVFVSNQGGPGLWWMPLDGSQAPRRLEGAPSGATGPAFSPDGQNLACAAPDEDGQSQIFLYHWSSHSSQQLTHLDTQVGSPAWFPDSGRLAVVMEGSTVASLPAGGGTSVPLIAGAGWNNLPNLSPDGKWLAFMSNRDGNPEIYRQQLGSAQVERLTQNSAYATHPVWSDDGFKLLFERDSRVWSMNADGSEARILSQPSEEMPSGASVPESDAVYLPAQ